MTWVDLRRSGVAWEASKKELKWLKRQGISVTAHAEALDFVGKGEPVYVVDEENRPLAVYWDERPEGRLHHRRLRTNLPLHVAAHAVRADSGERVDLKARDDYSDAEWLRILDASWSVHGTRSLGDPPPAPPLGILNRHLAGDCAQLIVTSNDPATLRKIVKAGCNAMKDAGAVE